MVVLLFSCGFPKQFPFLFGKEGQGRKNSGMAAKESVTDSEDFLCARGNRISFLLLLPKRPRALRNCFLTNLDQFPTGERRSLVLIPSYLLPLKLRTDNSSDPVFDLSSFIKSSFLPDSPLCDQKEAAANPFGSTLPRDSSAPG